MTITRPAYVTREAVKAALDVATTAYADTRVDRAIEAASDTVDGLCQRRFWPWQGTRYFDWPDWWAQGVPWRLWLDDSELVSAASVVTAGVPLTPGEYFLRRSDRREEPPYTHIEVNLATNAAFGGGQTFQRSIAVTGVFGHSADETAAGALAAAVTDATATRMDVTDSAAVGVGDLLRVDTERVLVVDKRMLTTGQTLQSPGLTAAASGTSLNVTSGAGYAVGETLLLDAERVLVLDVAGNTLRVQRAFDGSALAAHTGSTVYARRTLTVVRGFGGTTAATHSSATPVVRHVPPPLVRDLALAYAVNQLQQEQAGYARASGEGDHRTEVLGRGVVKGIEADCLRRFGRQARVRAV